MLDREGFAQARVRPGKGQSDADGRATEGALSLGVTGSGVGGSKKGATRGSVDGSAGKVSAALKKRAKAVQELYGKLPAGEKQAIGDIVEAVQAACADEVGSGGYSSAVEVIADRLSAEDSNKNNSVNKRSLLAALGNVGIATSFWAQGTPKGIRKRVLESVEKWSKGDGIHVDDFLGLLLIRL